MLQIKLHPALSKEDPAIIAAVTGVLDWSQKYMRGRQVCNNDGREATAVVLHNKLV